MVGCRFPSSTEDGSIEAVRLPVPRPDPAGRFPSSTEDGSIEAASSTCCLLSSSWFPSSTEDGSIEALLARLGAYLSDLVSVLN